MSKKINGMFGSESRSDEVIEWLKSQGATNITVKGTLKDRIYYVDKNGITSIIDKEYAELFDIVELSRWRAKKDEIYYYITDTGEIFYTFDKNTEYDKERYKIGNYFKTWDEVSQYSRKIREIFKRKE